LNPSSGNQWKRHGALAVLCGLLALSTLAAYWPVRHHEFIYYDDPEFVTENAQVQTGLKWSTVRYAFSSRVVGNWHPLTMLSHAMDCQLFGTNPAAHHLVNAVFHALNAIVLLLLLRYLTTALWRSAIVAGVFALHPLRVESVAWVAERKDLLCGLFFLLSIWLYAHYARRRSASERLQPNSPASAKRAGGWGFYAASFCMFACGLLSKPMIVTLPFVLLLLDFWPLQRFAEANKPFGSRRLTGLVLEKVPFLVLSVALSLITVTLQRASGATSVVHQAGWLERLSNAVTSYLRYLGKAFWPADLAVIYPHPARHYYLSDQWPGWEVAAAGLLLCLISVLALRWSRPRPYFAFGWFWFIGMLVPVIGLIQAGEQAMADRYTYLPLIGPTISLVWWVAELRPRLPTFFAHAVAPCATVLVLAALFVTTQHQLGFWQNTLTLFQHAAEVTADNPSAQFGIGMGLVEEGRISQAMVRFRVAAAIDPSYARAHYIMGQLLRMQGHLQAAADQYQAAVRCNPSDVQALVDYGGLLPALGRPKDAIRCLDEALRLDPNSVEGLNNLAWVLASSSTAELRDGSRAVQLGERACQLTHFKQAALIGTLGAAYAEAGEYTKAVAAAQRAIAVANESGESDLAARNQELLGLYRSRKAYPLSQGGP